MNSPASAREALLSDAIRLLVASLGGASGLDDGAHVHALTYVTDGDGWNEPHSATYGCECGQWEGLSWTQVDVACTGRPDEVEAVLAWCAHTDAALDSPASADHEVPLGLGEVSTAREATRKQRDYIDGLLRTREVPAPLRARATQPHLTHADCVEVIPLLAALPPLGHGAHTNEDDYVTPEGYDDNPDQGVHRFDGGGSW